MRTEPLVETKSARQERKQLTGFRGKLGIFEPAWQYPSNRPQGGLYCGDCRNIVDEKGLITGERRRHGAEARNSGTLDEGREEPRHGELEGETRVEVMILQAI